MDDPRDPGGTPKDDILWYRSELKHLRGKIQGYQALGSLLHDSKQEIRQLKHQNGQLQERLDEQLVSGPSSSLLVVTSPLNVNSRVEEMETEPQKASGSHSIASENRMFEGLEDVNIHSDVLAKRSESTHLKSVAPESLEIDPYDLQLPMDVPASTGMITSTPQDPFSISNLPGSSFEHFYEIQKPRNTPSSNGETSSIVQIYPEYSGVAASLLAAAETGPADAGNDDAPLVNQVEHISQELTRNVGLQSPSNLSTALAKLAIGVLKVEKELQMKQELINNLCPENQKLKMKLEETIQIRDQSIQELTVENNELREKLAEASRNISPEAVKSPEWVHVESPQSLEKVKKRFERQIRGMESQHAADIQELQGHLRASRAKLREAESAAAKCQENNQRLLNMTKERVNEEKKSKEETLSAYHIEQERRHQCETELIAARRQASTLEAQFSTVETPQRTNPPLVESMNSLAFLSMEDLRTKIHLLQQQVKIYEEDFEREREDRGNIQDEKDIMETELNQCKAQMMTTQHKIAEKEREKDLLKSENRCLRQEFQQIRQSEQEVVRLQSENAQFRELLHEKIEEIHRMTVVPTAPHESTIGKTRTTARETWTCTSCTYVNLGVRSSCEVCGRSRKRSSRKPTDAAQHSRLVPHSTAVRGRTECDSAKPNRVTCGDDLIIDEGQDVLDTE